MGILDFLHLGGTGSQDPAGDYYSQIGEAPPNAGLFGLLNTDQSYQLSKLSDIMTNLAWGHPTNLAGTDLQYATMADARKRRAQELKWRKAYADKLRAAGKNDLADMVMADPEYAKAIIGKQLDPQTMFVEKLFGGDPTTASDTNALIEKAKKVSGFPDLSQEEAIQILGSAAAGSGALANTLASIRTNRRLEADSKATQDAKDALIASVQPFVEEVRKTNPTLAKAYERNPTQALEAMQKAEAERTDPEYQRYNKMFEGMDPNNVTAEDIKRVSKLAGLTLNGDEVAQLSAAGPKQLGETINQIRDEQRAKSDAQLAREQHLADQSNMDTARKQNNIMKLRDDYARDSKGYQTIVDAGDRVQNIVNNKSLGAPQQIQVLYEFVKALDSSSAVREGEVGLAQKVASYKDLIETYMHRVDKGEILAEDAAREIGQQVLSLAEFADRRLYQIKKQMDVTAKEMNIDPNTIYQDQSAVDMSGFTSRFSATPASGRTPQQIQDQYGVGGSR